MATKAERYQVERGGRTVGVTVPERQESVAYSGEAAEVLRDILADYLSPQGVAAVAYAVRVQLNSRKPARHGLGRMRVEDAAVRRELVWLAEILASVVGGQDECDALCEEAGLRP